MEFMEKDSLRMEFIQSIVRNGERKVKKVMERLMKRSGPSSKGQEAAE